MQQTLGGGRAWATTHRGAGQAALGNATLPNIEGDEGWRKQMVVMVKRAPSARRSGANCPRRLFGTREWNSGEAIVYGR